MAQWRSPAGRSSISAAMLRPKWAQWLVNEWETSGFPYRRRRSTQSHGGHAAESSESVHDLADHVTDDAAASSDSPHGDGLSARRAKRQKLTNTLDVTCIAIPVGGGTTCGASPANDLESKFAQLPAPLQSIALARRVSPFLAVPPHGLRSRRRELLALLPPSSQAKTMQGLARAVREGLLARAWHEVQSLRFQGLDSKANHWTRCIHGANEQHERAQRERRDAFLGHKAARDARLQKNDGGDSAYGTPSAYATRVRKMSVW